MQGFVPHRLLARPRTRLEFLVGCWKFSECARATSASGHSSLAWSSTKYVSSRLLGTQRWRVLKTLWSTHKHSQRSAFAPFCRRRLSLRVLSYCGNRFWTSLPSIVLIEYVVQLIVSNVHLPFLADSVATFGYRRHLVTVVQVPGPIRRPRCAHLNWNFPQDHSDHQFYHPSPKRSCYAHSAAFGDGFAAALINDQGLPPIFGGEADELGDGYTTNVD